MSKKLDDLLKHAESTSNPADLDSDLKAASDLAKQNLAQPTIDDPAENLTQKVIERLKNEAKKAQVGNTSNETAGFSRTVSKSPYQPDVQIIPPPSTADQNGTPKVEARPAQPADLSKLTEADILNLDFVDAKSFDIPAMLQVEPRDGNIRFRWVNFKNYEGGNYAMFKALGFQNAVPADVKGELSEHLLKEDGTIKWFDVVLMKVPVLHLMGIYKKNIIKALMKVGRWQPEAIAQAKRTLEHDVGSDVLAALRKQGKNVEFYAPSVKEMSDQDKSFVDGV
jgi:hypothetical protein